MTLTLLLDLDDTLLINPIHAFQKEYFKLLGQHLQPFVSAARMLPELMRATESMLQKTTPAGTLEETFDAAFYPAVHVEKEQIIGKIDQFYQDVYPQLRALTQPRPQAIALVKTALEHNWQVIIATNPLFPRTAIYQRLTWAGLDPAELPFTLITTFEDSHFSKPHTAYYAEILAKLGWPANPIAMVGNSYSDDILPAACLGISTYYLSNEALQPTAEFKNTSHRSGDLNGVLPFLEHLTETPVKPGSFDREANQAVLASTPAALETIFQSATRTLTKYRPEPDEWSIIEIFCHLNDVDQEINLPRLERILAEKEPFLPGIISDTWASERNYQSQGVAEALNQFFIARAQLISRLSRLKKEDWDRTARHAIFGPTRLEELVDFMAQHDRNHIQQIGNNIRKYNNLSNK